MITCKDFGGYRIYGKKYEGLFHRGHDINNVMGTPVVSMNDCEVVIIGQFNGFGGRNPSKKGGAVWVKEKNCFRLYGHIQYVVKISDKLKEGDLIGYIDNYFIGQENIPHLHLGKFVGEKIPVNNWGYGDNLINWSNPLN
jgi:murein DD-endopeptidase MepM/ murein hydrolase activator NlpD